MKYTTVEYAICLCAGILFALIGLLFVLSTEQVVLDNEIEKITVLWGEQIPGTDVYVNEHPLNKELVMLEEAGVFTELEGFTPVELGGSMYSFTEYEYSCASTDSTPCDGIIVTGIKLSRYMNPGPVSTYTLVGGTGAFAAVGLLVGWAIVQFLAINRGASEKHKRAVDFYP